jgi:glycine/D-amino acid oxidase-like deaminating enzyme
VVATAPAAPGLLPCPVYLRHGFEYAQQLPDGRVVCGGFSDLDGTASFVAEERADPIVHARIGDYLAADLGVGAAVRHRWVGLVGYSDDGLPFAGPVARATEGLLALGAYSGTGNLIGFLAGRALADRIAARPGADGEVLLAHLDPARPTPSEAGFENPLPGPPA